MATTPLPRWRRPPPTPRCDASGPPLGDGGRIGSADPDGPITWGGVVDGRAGGGSDVEGPPATSTVSGSPAGSPAARRPASIASISATQLSGRFSGSLARPAANGASTPSGSAGFTAVAKG